MPHIPSESPSNSASTHVTRLWLSRLPWAQNWLNRGWGMRKIAKIDFRRPKTGSRVQTVPPVSLTLLCGRTRAFRICNNIDLHLNFAAGSDRKTEIFFRNFSIFRIKPIGITPEVDSKLPFRIQSIARPPGRGSARPPPHKYH